MSDRELITAAERIARAITLHAASIEPRVSREFRGFGREDAICALADARLTPEEMLLVSILWLNQWEAFGDLSEATWHYVVRTVVIPRGWHRRIDERKHWYWRRMSQLALCEALLPSLGGGEWSACPACVGGSSGSGRCELCGDMRRIRYSGATRARIVGMPRRTWDRWQRDYLDYIRPIPREWEHHAEAGARAAILERRPRLDMAQKRA